MSSTNNLGHGSSGKGHQGGHGQGHKWQNGPTKPNQSGALASSTKFQGACTELKRHVFDCSNYKQADKFSTMLKKLTEHVGVTYKNGGNVCSSIAVETKHTITAPTAPTVVDATNPSAAKSAQLHIFDKKLDALVKHEEILDLNIQSLYLLVLGQCTNLLQTKLKQQATWETIKQDQDGIALLGLIKTVIHHFKDQKFLLLALYNMKLNLYNFWQQNLSNDDYLHKFNNLIVLAISYNGQVHDTAIQDLVMEDKHGTGTDYTTLNADQRTAVDDTTHELHCVTMFIVQLDKQQYG